MFYQADQNDKVFSSPAFVGDHALFNVMLRIVSGEGALIHTDGESALIARTSPAGAAWIWTKADIAEEQKKALADRFFGLFAQEGFVRFTARPEIAEYIAGRGVKSCKVEQRLLAQVCPRPRAVTAQGGGIAEPSEDDFAQIARLMEAFEQAVEHRSGELARYEEAARGKAAAGQLAVMKADGKVAAIAAINALTPRHARIAWVYTLPEYRCRGFAAALVADLCGRILKMGKIPLLYTDGDNPASNKSYKNAGFEVVGELHTARVQF